MEYDIVQIKHKPLKKLIVSNNLEEAIILIENGFFSNKDELIDVLNYNVDNKTLVHSWLDSAHYMPIKKAKNIEPFLNDFCLKYFSEYDIFKNNEKSAEDLIKKSDIKDKMLLYLYKKGFNPWVNDKNNKPLMVELLENNNYIKVYSHFNYSIGVMCQDLGWHQAVKNLEEYDISSLLMKGRSQVDLLNRLIEDGNLKRQGKPAIYKTINLDVLKKLIDEGQSIVFSENGCENGCENTLFNQLMEKQYAAHPANIIERAKLFSQYKPSNEKERKIIEKQKKQVLVYSLCDFEPKKYNDKNFNITEILKLEKVLKIENLNEAFVYENKKAQFCQHLLVKSFTNGSAKQTKQYLNTFYKIMSRKKMYINESFTNKNDQAISSLVLWFATKSKYICMEKECAGSSAARLANDFINKIDNEIFQDLKNNILKNKNIDELIDMTKQSIKLLTNKKNTYSFVSAQRTYINKIIRVKNSYFEMLKENSLFNDAQNIIKYNINVDSFILSQVNKITAKNNNFSIVNIEPILPYLFQENSEFRMTFFKQSKDLKNKLFFKENLNNLIDNCYKIFKLSEDSNDKFNQKTYEDICHFFIKLEIEGVSNIFNKVNEKFLNNQYAQKSESPNKDILRGLETFFLANNTAKVNSTKKNRAIL